MQAVQKFKIPGYESLDVGDRCRLGYRMTKRLRAIQIRLAGINRIDAVSLQAFQFLFTHLPFQNQDLCATYHRIAIRQKFQTLFGGVRPLVKLAGQILDPEDRFPVHPRTAFPDNLDRRLGKKGLLAAFPDRVRYPFHVVSKQVANTTQTAHSQIPLDVRQKGGCFLTEFRTFFHVQSPDHASEMSKHFADCNTQWTVIPTKELHRGKVCSTFLCKISSINE